MTSWRCVEAGERLERRHPVLLGLADADEDPARERDPQLAGGADRREPQRRVLGRRALVGDEVGAQRLEHQPLRGRHLAQPGEVVARRARRGSCAAAARARARARSTTRRRRRSPSKPELGEPLAHARVVAGSSPVSTSSSLTPRRAARSSSRSTSSGSCRCGWCVANAQYLQWQTHVRDSDSVTLREKVTRRRIRPARYAARAHVPCSSRSRPAARSPAAAAAPGATGPTRTATLLLDFTPNAVHAGHLPRLDARLRRGRGRRRCRSASRGASTDALKLLQSGPRRHGDPRHPRPRAGAREGRATWSA